MGQFAAQERRCFHAIGYRYLQVKKYHVAAGFRRFLDRGRAIVYRPAHFVGGCDFDEISNSTAHGGAVVHNKESGLARMGHKREKLLWLVARNNTEMRIFSHRSVSLATWRAALECDGCPDVFRGKVRIIFEQVALGGALGELAQDKLDGDARAANHGFAHHDGGINGDSFRGHSRALLPS